VEARRHGRLRPSGLSRDRGGWVKGQGGYHLRQMPIVDAWPTLVGWAALLPQPKEETGEQSEDDQTAQDTADDFDNVR
jgi:hypothetical protein